MLMYIGYMYMQIQGTCRCTCRLHMRNTSRCKIHIVSHVDVHIVLYVDVDVHVNVDFKRIMTSDLAPDEHRAKDDLKAVEEVVADDDDGAAT